MSALVVPPLPEDMSGVLRLTNSEMASWRLCRRDWFLRYYLALVPRVGPEAGSPLSIGTAAHDALAAYYAQLVEGHAGDVLPPAAFVPAVYAAAMENEPHRAIDLAKEQDLVSIMLDGYGDWLAEEGADIDIRVLAPETKLEVAIRWEGDRILATLLTKLDARAERITTGERVALEHKTCTNLKQVLPLLQGDTQLLTEHLAEKLALVRAGGDGRRADGVLYNMLRKVKRTGTSKPPFYGREWVTHNDAELRSHYAHVRAMAAGILDARARLDAGESHHTVCPPSPSRELSWKSAFLHYYVLMDDGSDWRAALDDHFTPGDALARYDGTTSLED